MPHRPHDPVQRVNDKHAGELLALARSIGGRPDATAARAERIDSGGIDMVLTTPGGDVGARIPFVEPVSDPRRMRAAFRVLTRQAHARADDEDEPGP